MSKQPKQSNKHKLQKSRKLLISACIVAWNGEKQIKDCIESIKEVVDDIVVVHDGPCNDSTLNICRKYTRKIFARPYVGEAEPHRPFSFSKASGKWILWIDQDEQLTPALKRNLRKLAADAERKGVAAYTFLWPVKYKNSNLKRGFFSRVRKMVFFRKDAYSYNGLPNETLKIRGKIVDTEYWFRHIQQGKRNTLKIFFTKTLRIVRIHARQMVEKRLVRLPAPWYAIKAFIWFFLYLEYYYIIKAAFRTKADISISFQHALYNFFLYVYVFQEKLKR